jgi:predicted outer membrane repeat protein
MQIIALLIVIAICQFAYGKVIYVDDDATGANDGSSWDNAYNFLQDALADANSSQKPAEVRVAQGIYTPDSNSAVPHGTGDREATFHLINGVAIKGAYAGIGETDPNARDVATYETVLSGDLGGNDVDVDKPEDLLWEPSRGENSYHVVTASWTDSTAVLDGLNIVAGNANHPSGDVNSRGGAMYNNCGSPTVSYCTLGSNSAISGGAIHNSGSSPTLTNCTFWGNSAKLTGGGICNEDSTPNLIKCTFTDNRSEDGAGMLNDCSSPVLISCIFIQNSANWCGGGMCNCWSHPTLANCTFCDNTANFAGGGMYNDESSPVLADCTFTSNSARYDGGGMFNDDNQPALINCTFSGNSALRGGGMANSGSSPTLTHCAFRQNNSEVGGGMANDDGEHQSKLIVANCTFTGNSAGQSGGAISLSCGRGICEAVLMNCRFGRNASREGGAIRNYQSTLKVANCTFTANTASSGSAVACGSYQNPSNTRIANSILWDGDKQISHDDNSALTITYSDVQVAGQFPWPGEGNINSDPRFVGPGHRDSNGTPEHPNDDFWVDGDYHLQSQAGRWDPATKTWVKDDVTSPCIDAGDISSPIGYEAFPNGGRINMGTYGGTVEASKSYFGGIVCQTIVAGDINGDCKVNFADFAIMALHWLEDSRQPGLQALH